MIQSILTALISDGGLHLVLKGSSTEDNHQQQQQREVWLPPEWIRDNAEESCFTSNQLTLVLEDYSDSEVGQVVDFKISAASSETSSKDDHQGLVVTLSSGKTYTVKNERLMRYGLRQPAPELTPLLEVEKLQRVSFKDAIEGSGAEGKSSKIKLFEALLQDGIAIVDSCPEEDESVLRIARALAPATGELKTLYGTGFKVDTAARRPEPTPAKTSAENNSNDNKKDEPRSNIAYTGKFLDLHNDLPWYESMPGIQLLHCQQFDDAVTGGESFFVDAFGAAAELREKFPESFEVLTKVPVTFMRDDVNREVPARYYAAVPLIQLDLGGRIRKVVWSTQNEGPMPLHLGPDVLKQYYKAKRDFSEIMLNWRKNKKLFFKLRPGETVVWNQVRVLHGRMAFEEPAPGLRRLHGAYCNIDDFASAARQCVVYDKPDAADVPARIGNGSWM